VVEGSVSVNLDGHHFLIFVVIALESLAEGTFANLLQDLESVLQVVSIHHFVETFVLVEAIVGLLVEEAFRFSGVFSFRGSHEVDVAVLLDLFFFIWSEQMYYFLKVVVFIKAFLARARWGKGERVAVLSPFPRVLVVCPCLRSLIVEVPTIVVA